MPPVIKVENLSKMYRLGEVGTGTVRDDLARAWAKLRGKEDPFQKVGQVNRRDKAADGDHEYVWALQDINFEVEQGEILSIIGRNGAGKSTLLKLLSRITSPTTGRIRARGRIASLLEVGTGFHPELTGRENIYLNGALLGMTRREVTKRLEEIVEFSGCAKYIDTPVKRYSSGMMVRLGFSVAAHLECEILIVDEVLAVGDAEFQKKCIGKMQDVAEGGKTVLFVSHNMTNVRTLCERGIILSSGGIIADGPTETAILPYLKGSEAKETNVIHFPIVDEQSGLLLNDCAVTLNEATGNLHVHLEIEAPRPLSYVGIGLVVNAPDGIVVSKIAPKSTNFIITALHGVSTAQLTLHDFSRRLPSGCYSIGLWIALHQRKFLISLECVASVEVIGVPASDCGIPPHVIADGYALLPSSFQVEAGK